VQAINWFVKPDVTMSYGSRLWLQFMLVNLLFYGSVL